MVHHPFNDDPFRSAGMARGPANRGRLHFEAKYRAHILRELVPSQPILDDHVAASDRAHLDRDRQRERWIDVEE